MDIEKILSNLRKRTFVNPETNCWEFTGVNSDGYGQTSVKSKFFYVHVLSAKIFLGYTPTLDPMVCHKPECRSKACWNPDHIYVGNAKSNNKDIKDSGKAKGKYSDVTHCVNGHELTLVNTYWSYRSKKSFVKRRQCKICREVNDKKRKDRMKLLRMKIVG